jgi:RimJ/RimL family protein N-acetyltransferase
MLGHAFQSLERVIFHVGVNNLRSRKAMEKLGAVHIGEEPVSYYGEPSQQNVIYQIERAAWRREAANVA